MPFKADKKKKSKCEGRSFNFANFTIFLKFCRRIKNNVINSSATFEKLCITGLLEAAILTWEA